LKATGWGLSAYLVGYLITYFWKGQYVASIAENVVLRFQATGLDNAWAGETRLAYVLADTGVADTTWAGWLFYNAHFVPLSTGEFAYTGQPLASNLLIVAQDPLYLLLFLVPPVTLVLSGIGVSRNTLRRMTTISPSLGLKLPHSAVRGMSVIMGYLPAVIVGAFVFTADPIDERAALLAPELLLSFLVAGLLYPIVFGGLGGWIALKRTEANQDGSS